MLRADDQDTAESDAGRVALGSLDDAYPEERQR
jgi:hypothetical protein